MSRELRELISIVENAGREVLEFYHGAQEIDYKKDNSPITKADIASHEIITSALKPYKYGILSEEGDEDFSCLERERVWIVDPLDGTKDFIAHSGEFSIMVGLVERGIPILGVVYQPTESRIYFAELGEGAFVKEFSGSPRKLQVSDTSRISDARFLFSKNHFSADEETYISKNTIAKVRLMGSIGLKVGLIGEGKAEGYFSMTDKTCQWDTCAPEIILKEAGGVITDLDGKSLRYNTKDIRNLNGIVASNGVMHEEFLKSIKSK